MPPLTTRFLLLPIWLACSSLAMPVPLTVRWPAMDCPPVVFKSSSPALTVVKPVKVLMPDRVRDPDALLTVRVLPVPAMTPAKELAEGLA